MFNEGARCKHCNTAQGKPHLVEEGQDALTIKFASLAILIILLSIGGWLIFLALAAMVVKSVWGG